MEMQIFVWHVSY